MNNNEQGCVYFFKHKKLSPIKIGFTSEPSPLERFKSFKIFAPHGGVIVGFIMCRKPELLERKLHRQFSDKRLYGEWFEISEDTVNIIVDLHSSDEQKDLLYLIQEKMAIDISKGTEFEFRKFCLRLKTDFKIPTNLLCNDFNKFYQLSLSNRNVIKEIGLYCNFNNYIFRQGRDSKGRYCIITKTKEKT